MRLRYDERDRLLRLTHPPRVGAGDALAWAALHKSWVAGQIDRALPAEPLVPGATIPVEGRPVRLCWSKQAPRLPELAGGRIVCGGPEAGFARRVEHFLRVRALEMLSSETEQIASGAGLRATSVSVGDARTRWGSCSATGRIRYNWRLVLADPSVRRYVVAHEVAHLEHLDHGSRFKALEQRLFGGDVAAAKDLLRSTGPRLRRIGVGG